MTSSQARPPAFTYRDNALLCGSVEIESLAAKFGTPLYVYSADLLRERYRAFDAAFRTVPHTICYSVKANPNLAILKLLAKLKAGFDVVSGGELERVLIAAGKSAAKRAVFSGVGKTRDEMDAALKAGILIFNVESEEELALLSERATHLQKKARIALRVNPDVAAETHPYISTGLREHKFGIPIGQAASLYDLAARSRYLEVAGVSVHIGSQITSVEPFAAAMTRVAELVRDLSSRGHHIRYVDAGGGLGITYDPDSPDIQPWQARMSAYAGAVTSALRGTRVHLLLEPGRAVIAQAGALITRVLYHKRNGNKEFIVVDAAMNDLIRPSLYSAYHEIVPVRTGSGESSTVDVVGPVCETGDFFARDRKLPRVPDGELLAILDTGAYGMSLASNYNSRPRAAEVLVDGKNARLIRRRETTKDLTRAEQL